MSKTILVLVLVATFIAGMSAIVVQDNMASAAKPVSYRATAVTNLSPGASGSADALCNVGDRSTGGGFLTQPTVTVFDNEPLLAPGATSPTGWHVFAQNDGTSTRGFVAFVVCEP